MAIRTIVLLAGLAIPIYAGAFMNLFSGFTVEREVILNPEQLSNPRALVRAADGGYYVIGKDIGAWATKTDENGKALWTFQEPAPKGSAAHFLSAAPATDGGVLLCGMRDEFGPVGLGSAGLLIRLDKNGHEVSRIDPYLKSPEQVNQYTGVITCSRWGDGFMISGGARLLDRSADGKTTAHLTPMLMRLNNDGTLIWKKNIDGYFENPRIMSNGDMMFFGSGGHEGDAQASSFVTRVNGEGNVLAVGKYSDSDVGPACLWVADPRSVDRLRLICNPFGIGVTNKVSMVDLGADLRMISKTFIDLPEGMGAESTFYLSDGTLIVAGDTGGMVQRFVPTVVAVGPDGKVHAKHEFLGLDEWEISGMLPTGKPNEIVTVRAIERNGHRVTAMTFLRLN